MIAALLLVACLSDPAALEPVAERRIVHLADGSCVRAATRVIENGIEVRTGGVWRRIDALSVTSHALEREVVLEARARLDSVHPSAFGLRVEAARWMIAEGLADEATLELDRILRLAPDQRHVLALLATAPPRIDLGYARTDVESERSAWLRAGARCSGWDGSPTKRELVVKALAAAAQAQKSDPTKLAPTLHEDLSRELESGVTTRRAFACLALRRLEPGRALGQLAVHAVIDPALDVREGAISALRDARDPAACGAVVRALAGPNATIRGRAAHALGRMGYREAVEPLMTYMSAAAPAQAGGGHSGTRSHLFSGLSTAYVQDYDVEIAQGASIANPIVQALTSGVLFDVTVGGTSIESVTTEVWDAASALTVLTGQRFGTDVSKWQKWWAEHRDEYVPASRRTPRTGDY